MIDEMSGYGRYDDDGRAVGCPRAKSDMTPCIARDGKTALADDGVCVGCGGDPVLLLRDLRQKTRRRTGDLSHPERSANALRDLVRQHTDHLTMSVVGPSRFFKGYRVHKKNCRHVAEGNGVEMTLTKILAIHGPVEDCKDCGGRG